jgi:hypothetical protein
MTKSEINQKLAELRAQGEALQQNNSQIMQQLELNKVELAKICGKIELLSDMLSELENGEAEKDADKNDNG